MIYGLVCHRRRKRVIVGCMSGDCTRSRYIYGAEILNIWRCCMHIIYGTRALCERQIVRYLYIRYLYISPSSLVYHHMANSVSCSHALIAAPTSMRPGSEGGLYRPSGQEISMRSALYFGRVWHMIHCCQSPRLHRCPVATDSIM